MTVSFHRGDAGRAYVGRVYGAASAGQGRPISVFNLCAAVISDPKACSVGPAVILTDVIPPQGHPFHIPGCAGPSRQHTLDGRAPCGGVLGRPRTFFRTDTKRELGSDLLRDGAQRLPGVGALHGFNHGASNDREAVNLCRDFGNVCRVGA